MVRIWPALHHSTQPPATTHTIDQSTTLFKIITLPKPITIIRRTKFYCRNSNHTSQKLASPLTPTLYMHPQSHWHAPHAFAVTPRVEDSTFLNTAHAYKF
jgi:hypothetical protein